jgi:hypothetical protein
MTGNEIPKLQKFVKNKYFYGKLMTVRDFVDEQFYGDEKRRLINRLVHGSGLVCGFAPSHIRVSKEDSEKITITFDDDGVALDCCGQEIVVSSGEVKEVQFQGSANGVDFYYLYLKSNPVPQEKVTAASIGSGCEELCDDNRIKEDFEVIADINTPDIIVPCSIKEISGTVKNADTNTITLGDGNNASSKIKDAYKDMWITITEGTGKGQIRQITGYNELIKVVTVDPEWEKIPDVTSHYEIGCCPDFSVETNSIQAREKVKEWVEKISASCLLCDEEKKKVFLAAINKADLIINLDETRKYRSFVYNNKTLYKLLTCHISDFDNPHKTTAEQIGALKSINKVTSQDGNVDLVKDDSIKNSITIVPHDDNNTISIGETHSSITGNPHNTTAKDVGALISIDGVSNPGSDVDLVQKDSIKIEPDVANKKISIGETHSSITGNPHNTTAKDVGALKSINNEAGKDGNVNLVKDNSITIAVKNKSIIIGENHSSRTDNPHGTTAQQIGALKSINKVTSADGNIDLTSTNNTISINPTPGKNEIDLELSETIATKVTKIDQLERKIDFIQRYLMDKSLKYKLKTFTDLNNKFEGKLESANSIVSRVKSALEKKLYNDPEKYIIEMKSISNDESKLIGELGGKVTDDSLGSYTASVNELGDAVKSGDPIWIAVAQDEVCEMAEKLEKKTVIG